MKKLYPILLSVSVLALSGCATEGSRTVEVQKVTSYNTAYNGVKAPYFCG